MNRRLAAWSAALLFLAACSRKAPSIVDPRGSEARTIARVWWVMFALAAAVYVVVGGLIVIASLRGRRTREGRPSRISDSRFIWVGGILVPTAILAVLAVETVHAAGELRRPERAPLRIEVVGKQWWWAVSYPDQNVTTANEIHVPVGRQVEIGLTTTDVIHSFWVPQLAGKLDNIPGQRNVLRFTAQRPGTYRGECAEYCGVQHARMDFVVIADRAGDFTRWMTRRQSLGTEPASDQAALGRVVFERSACAGCHTITGTAATGTLGPDLTDFGGRTTIGAGTVPNTRGNLAGWIVNAQSIKPGNVMPPIALEPAEADAVVTYLESLK